VSALTDRIRGIVTPASARSTAVPAHPAHPVHPALPAHLAAPPADLSTLGGDWCGDCFVVDRRWPPSARYGKEAVGTFAQCLDEASSQAVLFAHDPPARAPFVFFDLETTGLSGGAGTQAFLVGCGRFDADGGFATRQFVLTRHADERPLLETVAGELARAGALVTFNGKSFDASLLETRYLFHRLEWSVRCLPHVDVLHPARQFWKPVARPLGRDRAVASPALREHACSLIALEREILGIRRTGDVPGFQVPGRYFHFVRTGDADPLAAVLEHNRRDLLSLAALTARLFYLARSGPEAARDPREAIALGRVYARAGHDDRACDAFNHALDRCRSPRGAFDPLRIDALRLLAAVRRRTRRHDEAASCWRALLEIRGCPPAVVREATEALAIHHEHRVRDLPAARLFALQSLETVEGGRPGWTAAVQHRLTRIDRKMGSKSEVGSLEFEV
jgi:uncharacterized protein YprB with RNaseH-like and TPR domain